MDSDKGDNDFTPFRNLFNDFYARDTSKKIRAVMRAKGNAGEHLCTNPPYGYMKDPADKKKWVVDEEAAEIVKQIFALCIAGKGPMQIAKLLTAGRRSGRGTAKKRQDGMAERSCRPATIQLLPYGRAPFAVARLSVWIFLNYSSLMVSDTGILQSRFAGERGAKREVNTSSANMPPMVEAGICHAIPQ